MSIHPHQKQLNMIGGIISDLLIFLAVGVLLILLTGSRVLFSRFSYSIIFFMSPRSYSASLSRYLYLIQALSSKAFLVVVGWLSEFLLPFLSGNSTRFRIACAIIFYLYFDCPRFNFISKRLEKIQVMDDSARISD